MFHSNVPICDTCCASLIRAAEARSAIVIAAIVLASNESGGTIRAVSDRQILAAAGLLVLRILGALPEAKSERLLAGLDDSPDVGVLVRFGDDALEGGLLDDGLFGALGNDTLDGLAGIDAKGDGATTPAIAAIGSAVAMTVLGFFPQAMFPNSTINGLEWMLPITVFALAWSDICLAARAARARRRDVGQQAQGVGLVAATAVAREKRSVLVLDHADASFSAASTASPPPGAFAGCCASCC